MPSVSPKIHHWVWSNLSSRVSLLDHAVHELVGRLQRLAALSAGLQSVFSAFKWAVSILVSSPRSRRYKGIDDRGLNNPILFLAIGITSTPLPYVSLLLDDGKARSELKEHLQVARLDLDAMVHE